MAFLKWFMEAFRQYTHYDPSIKEHKTTVTMTFVDHAVRNTNKLQRQERFQGKSLRELVQVAEKVYQNRETEERRREER